MSFVKKGPKAARVRNTMYRSSGRSNGWPGGSARSRRYSRSHNGLVARQSHQPLSTFIMFSG
jgi:hypothetical protein